MVTGVVGKSCSGKDSAVRYLVRNGFYEINVDHLGHEALEVKKEELRAAFGDGIFTDGHVNRKILGPIVFSDAAKLAMGSCTSSLHWKWGPRGPS